MQQADAVVFGFSEPDNSAAAHGDSGFSHGRKRAQAVVVIARRDDLPVKLRRSVQVVVVRGEAGFGQAFGLRIVEHSQRAANFHAKLCDTADHLQNIFKIFAFLHLTPRGAHAETRRPFTACTFGKFGDFVNREQSAARYFRRVMRALRAIGAILRAPACFHREQAAELDAIGIVEFAVQLLRGEKKIGQRLPVDPANFFASPVMSARASWLSNCSAILQQGRSSRAKIVSLYSSAAGPAQETAF